MRPIERRGVLGIGVEFNIWHSGRSSKKHIAPTQQCCNKGRGRHDLSERVFWESRSVSWTSSLLSNMINFGRLCCCFPLFCGRLPSSNYNTSDGAGGQMTPRKVPPPLSLSLSPSSSLLILLLRGGGTEINYMAAATGCERDRRMF